MNPWARVLLISAVLVFAALSTVEVASRFRASWATLDSRYDTARLRPLTGSQPIEWEFEPPAESLELVWILAMPFDEKSIRDQTLRVRLTVVSTSRELAILESPIPEATFRGQRATLRFEGVIVPPGERLRMNLSLPETPPTEGFYVATVGSPTSNGLVRVGSQILDQTDLGMVWVGSLKPFPRLYVVLGVLLLVTVTRAPTGRSELSQAVVLTAILLLVASHANELRLHHAPQNFWPDEYVPMAQEWFDFLSGQTGAAEFHDQRIFWRNGQVFLVPLLIAVVRLFGVDPAGAYELVVCAFTFASVIIFVRVGCRLHGGDAIGALAMYAALLTSPFVIRASATLLTDMVGVFFSLASIAAVASLVGSSPPRRPGRMSLGLSSSLVLGSISRIQILPLVALPACAGLWGRFVCRTTTGPRMWLLTSVTVASAISLVLIWWGLDLFSTFEKAQAFASNPMFLDAFSWKRFAWMTGICCASGLVAVACDPGRILREPRFAAIAGGVCALLLILALGRIIPWYRYWSPIYLPSLMLALVFAYGTARPRWWVPGLMSLSVVANLYATLARGALVEG